MLSVCAKVPTGSLSGNTSLKKTVFSSSSRQLPVASQLRWDSTNRSPSLPSMLEYWLARSDAGLVRAVAEAVSTLASYPHTTYSYGYKEEHRHTHMKREIYASQLWRPGNPYQHGSVWGRRLAVLSYGRR